MSNVKVDMGNDGFIPMKDPQAFIEHLRQREIVIVANKLVEHATQGLNFKPALMDLIWLIKPEYKEPARKPSIWERIFGKGTL